MRSGDHLGWLAIAAAINAGCVSAERVALPPPPEGARSILLALDVEDGPFELYAFEGTRPDGSFTLREQTQLTLLSLAGPLVEYQIKSGLQPPSLAEPQGRALPDHLAAHTATTSDAPPAWDKIEALPPKLARYRLPELDPIACAAEGRCLKDQRCRECGQPIAPSSPDPPEPPEFDQCPENWTLTPLAEAPGLEYCEPFPGGSACPNDQVLFPGDENCHALQPCDAEFPEDLPAGATIAFVSPGAESGGDGTRLRPLRSLIDALAGTAEIIALGPGTHPGGLVLARPVALIGACASTTIIEDNAAPVQISVTAPGVRIERVTIRGPGAGISVAASGELELRSAILDRLPGGPLNVAAARARLSEVLIAGLGAEAILADSGAHLVLDRVRLIGAAVFVQAASAELDRVFISDLGRDGVAAITGSTISIRRSVLERTRHAGIYVKSSPTATISDVLVRDTAVVLSGDQAGRFGHAIELNEVGDAKLERAFLDRSRGRALWINEGTIAAVRDVITRCTEPEEVAMHPAKGDGVYVTGAAQMDAARIASAGDTGAGLFAGAASITATDLSIDRFCAGEHRGEGGLLITQAASATLRRVAIRSVKQDALMIDYQDTRLHLSDYSVYDTTNNGIQILCGRSGSPCSMDVLIEKARIENADSSALLIDSVEGVVLRDVELVNPGNAVGFMMRGVARLEVQAFVARGFSSAIQLGSQSLLELRSGRVSHNAIAIQTVGEPDLTHLFDDVIYEENGQLHEPAP